MLPVLRKIMNDLLKEKTFVFVLLLQVFLVLSMTVILNFTGVFFNPESMIEDEVNIGVIGKGAFSEYLAGEKTSITYYTSQTEALDEFREGKTDAVVDEVRGPIPSVLKLYLPESKLKSSVVMSVMKERLESFEDERRNQLFDEPSIRLSQVSVNGGRSKGSEHIFEVLYGFLIPFLFLVPIFLIGSLIIDNVSEEIESGTMSLLLTATSLRRFILETVAAALIITFLQVFLWLILITVKGILVSEVLLMLSYILVFSLFIFAVASSLSLFLRNKTRTQLVYSIIVMFISITPGLFFFNPVNVLSKSAIGVEMPSLISFLIPLALAGALFYIMPRKNHNIYK
ncbi:MAG: ABC transporter permease [Nanobdellota archaeon]